MREIPLPNTRAISGGGMRYRWRMSTALKGVDVAVDGPGGVEGHPSDLLHGVSPEVQIDNDVLVRDTSSGIQDRAWDGNDDRRPFLHRPDELRDPGGADLEDPLQIHQGQQAARR